MLAGIFFILLLIPTYLGDPLASYLNDRVLVRKSCQWMIRKGTRSNLMADFFSKTKGECLYALTETKDELLLDIDMKDPQDEMRQVFITIIFAIRNNRTSTNVRHGEGLQVSFKDSTNITLFGQSIAFQEKMKSKKVKVALAPNLSKLTLKLPDKASYIFYLDVSQSSYSEQLMVIWLIFVFLNYQWFYFKENQGLILREFKSIKKGWCFRAVSVFLINHTSFPLSITHQFQKFSSYIRSNQEELVDLGLVLGLMAAILVFIGLQMARLMKKVSFRSQQSLHIRQALDYILVFTILIIPFEYVLILMPIAKFLQIWYLLTLQEVHYISYYEQFGKVAFDWVQGMYFTLYSRNFAQIQPNYAAFAFSFVIFIIEVMIFLMELLSHQEFKEMRETAKRLYAQLSTFYIRVQAKRAEIDKCSICLQSFSSKGALEVYDEGHQQIFEAVTIAITRCNHRFHAACIEKWFRDGNQNCPLDRQDLRHEKRKHIKSKEF